MTDATANIPTIVNMEVVGRNSFALRHPSYVDNFVLAADVAENFTVPAGAQYAIIAATENVWARYITDDESEALVTNGTFAADTSWTKGTGWTIAAGVATSDASQTGNSDLEQTNTDVVEGKAYLVTFTVSAYTAGNVRPVIGGTTGTNRASAATFSETIIAGSTDVIALRADLDFNGSVDNFTVAPIATVPAADVSTGAGQELNPTVRFVSKVDKISLIASATCKGSIAYYA